MQVKHVKIYTDGGCRGNPGPGGYAAVLLINGHRKEISGGYRLTTNNRMELMAAIAGLKALKRPCKVTLYSDSQYLVNAINKGWLTNWIKRNWIKSDKAEVKNIDLWQQLSELCRKHEITFIWIKGHDGNIENERCDRLAVDAANRKDLPPDILYEKGRGAL
jgi:ribonuclease HI